MPESLQKYMDEHGGSIPIDKCDAAHFTIEKNPVLNEGLKIILHNSSNPEILKSYESSRFFIEDLSIDDARLLTKIVLNNEIQRGTLEKLKIISEKEKYQIIASSIPEDDILISYLTWLRHENEVNMAHAKPISAEESQWTHHSSPQSYELSLRAIDKVLQSFE